jgi:hypothetical protein
MYFRVVDHYQDEKDNNIIQNNNNNDNIVFLSECFVCYEITNETECEPIKLHKQTYYIKNCCCDGFIHKQCLDKWFKNTKSCPICRNNIYENDTTLTVSIIKNKSFGHAFFAFILLKKNIQVILNYSSFLFFVVFFIEFYLSVIDKSYCLENK